MTTVSQPVAQELYNLRVVLHNYLHAQLQYVYAEDWWEQGVVQHLKRQFGFDYLAPLTTNERRFAMLDVASLITLYMRNAELHKDISPAFRTHLTELQVALQQWVLQPEVDTHSALVVQHATALRDIIKRPPTSPSPDTTRVVEEATAPSPPLSTAQVLPSSVTQNPSSAPPITDVPPARSHSPVRSGTLGRQIARGCLIQLRRQIVHSCVTWLRRNMVRGCAVQLVALVLLCSGIVWLSNVVTSINPLQGLQAWYGNPLQGLQTWYSHTLEWLVSSFPQANESERAESIHIEPAASPTPSTPTLQVGGRARIVTTGGSNARVRGEPDLADQPRILGLPNGTEVTILDGPIEVDDLAWWQISAGEIEGWTAATLLEPIE